MPLTREDRDEIKEITSNIETVLNGVMGRLDRKIESIEADAKRTLDILVDMRIQHAVTKRDVYILCGIISAVASSAIALLFRKL